MKKQRHSNLSIRSSLAIVLALATWSAVQSQSTGHGDVNVMTTGNMMNHNDGWIGGWPGGWMLVWTVVGILAVVLIVVVIIKLLKK